MLGSKMEEFLGKSYEMVSEENLEAYLVLRGVSYLKRKIAVNMRPTQTLSRNADGTYKFQAKATLLNWEVDFTPGAEYEATSPDGDSKIVGVITFEGNVMTHKQTEKGVVSIHKLEFSPEETVVTTTVEGSDLVLKRVYKLVK